MSIAPTFSATPRPSTVPRVMASMTFVQNLGSGCVGPSPVAEGRVSGYINLAIANDAGAPITLAAIRCAPMFGTELDNIEM